MAYADPEKEREYRAAYRERNREAYNERMRKWRKTPAGQAWEKRAQELRKEKRQSNPDIARAEKLRFRYKLTVDQYDSMEKQQQGLCAICHGPSRDGRRLHVDHDHSTGQVRELLCGACNRAVGYLQESEEIALSLAGYLRRWKVENA